jgi:arylsulfatase A-like enzyme
MRPNVLLVVLDAARRDSLEPYGAAAGGSPTIAQLASRGAALPDVYATGCWTVPSHSSMFTGLMPRASGLAEAATPHVVKPVLETQRDRLLPEVLRREGYATAAVSANLWVSEASGFCTGFDEFVQVDTGRHAKMHASRRRDRLRWQAEAARGRVDDGAADARAIVERWIAQPRSEPFFLFVNLVECHSPYLPPRPYGHAGTLDRVRAADEARRYYGLGPIWAACAGEVTLPDATLERMRRLYAGAIRYMDDWVASVLESIDRAGALDETVVIVTSDHGENFGEGGLITHAFSLDNRLIHVPFVFAGPGVEGLSMNSLVELPRVVASLAAIDDHPWRETPPSGVGIAQFDPPAEASDPHTAATIATFSEQAQVLVTTPLTCAVAGGLKLLQRDDREEVYDLGTDPLEMAPLTPEAASADGHRAGLDVLRAALEHPMVSARATTTQPDAGASSADEARDLEERMRLLGYM